MHIRPVSIPVGAETIAHLGGLHAFSDYFQAEYVRQGDDA